VRPPSRSAPGGPAGSFEFVEDVTSDLSFRARGPTPEAAFAAAADALLAATVESPEVLAETVTRTVILEEGDLELLLLRFLNELIYLRDAEGLLLRARSLEIRREGGRDGAAVLTAELAGEPFDAARHGCASEVKAATAHGLRMRAVAGGWEATATLDV
jgi:SHS2 domain-containing protein